MASNKQKANTTPEVEVQKANTTPEVEVQEANTTPEVEVQKLKQKQKVRKKWLLSSFQERKAQTNQVCSYQLITEHFGCLLVRMLKCQSV